MTTHRIPLPDWRDNTRGLPVYSFDGKSMEPSAKTIEEILDDIDRDAALQEQIDATREKIRRAFNPICEAQEAVEGISDRPQTPRPGAEQ